MGRAGSFVFLVLVVFAALTSCAQEEYPVALWLAQHRAADAGASTAAPDLASCRQAQAQSLPARLVAMSAPTPASAGTTVLASDIFQDFVSVCGGCHGPNVDPPGEGMFQIQAAAYFTSEMTCQVIQHVTAAVCPSTAAPGSADEPMPPCGSGGETYTARSSGDGVLLLAELVVAWINAGSPPSFTYVQGSPSTPCSPGSALSAAAAASTSTSSMSPLSPEGDAGGADGDGGSAASYRLSPAQGDDMTNIGYCIPSPSMVGTNTAAMAALDAQFEAMQSQPNGTPQQAIGLPQHLSETDLSTFDTAALAQNRVIAYAPGYPLWSDNAGKLRYVRVPLGQSIQFDKATQQFHIPPNTRFYKTFMKQIIDTDGSYRYRKIETRLIVARPDQNNADGTVSNTALFGTYLWNQDESDAELFDQKLLLDLQPFPDDLLLYNTDEQLAADILASQPANPELALIEGHAARHYAVPSSERCGQCHMGSENEDFILGFIPLQINRRPIGVSGTIEPTGPDELTQLQRFIDYGIITGIDSPSDIVPLEQSQGSRTPRNSYELTAQGYLLGNCSHCHNPRGYPSVQNPVLVDVLDFLPGPMGGIFQFPLERYSPRIGRGQTGTTPIPYVTPSLMDLPPTGNVGAPNNDAFMSAGGPDDNGNPTLRYGAYAPWRSIIYRNVDSAFAYTYDNSLFPHMPMNTPGYDPTLKQIVADWMVSIPAVRKRPDIPEYAFNSLVGTNLVVAGGDADDTEPQPYVEVDPGDPRYDDAVLAANTRLDILHTGSNPVYGVAPTGVTYSRYADPGITDDILDPQVIANSVCQPTPAPGLQVLGPTGIPLTLALPVIQHPHWVTTDLTQLPPPYEPRRGDWANILVSLDKPAYETSSCPGASADQAQAYTDQLEVVSFDQQVNLTQVRDFVTTPLPLGLWAKQPGCDYSSQPTVQSFTGSQRMYWMDHADPPPPPDAAVYTESPGAAVFKLICINCHGPLADSNGRMAQNLATMTGGVARVADFRAGLFGPLGATELESNRHLAFGLQSLPANAPPNWTTQTADGTPISDDDRASRYMAWMALGGTEVTIPPAILQIIAATQFFGVTRLASVQSANMLGEAKALCLSTMGPPVSPGGNAISLGNTQPSYLALPQYLNPQLLSVNGDAELWLRLCSANNPPPIHVLSATTSGPEVNVAYDSNGLAVSAFNIVDASFYPSSRCGGAAPDGGPSAASNCSMGNERGGVDSSLLPTNLWPWCLDPSSVTNPPPPWVASLGAPLCPPEVTAEVSECKSESPQAEPCYSNDDANRWAVRGAMNAGFAVYLYVQQLESMAAPPPDYNQCPSP